MFRVIILFLLVGGLVFAQTNTKPVPSAKPAPVKDGTLTMVSGPGAFRAEGEGKLVLDVLGGSDARDAGTIYVSGLVGTLNVQGLRLEYQDKSRKCYRGVGHVEVNGKFRAVNFLGAGVKGTFTGHGSVRLYGDLDKNGRTGIFYYPDLKDAKGQQVYENWETNGREVAVPRPSNYMPVRPTTGSTAEE